MHFFVASEKKMRITFYKAFLFYYVGVFALTVVFQILSLLSPPLAASLAGLVVFAVAFHLLYMSSMSRAIMIHRCLDMGGRTVRETGVMILICCIFFPLYPLLVTPLLVMAAYQMTQGGCSIE